jgi:hypothetical protein
MPAPSFADYAASYRCTVEGNDQLVREFTAATWADPLLAEHRRHIPSLGFKNTLNVGHNRVYERTR